MIIAMSILAAIAVMAAFPEAPVSRFLRRCLVEAPAAWLEGLTLRSFAFSLLALLAMVIVLAAAPEAAAMFFALGADAAALELLAALWLASTVGSLRSLWRGVMRLASRLARLAGRTVVLARRTLPRPRRRRLGDKPPRRPDDSRPEPRFAGRLAWAFD
jgi:hypothetical protein